MNSNIRRALDVLRVGIALGLGAFGCQPSNSAPERAAQSSPPLTIRDSIFGVVTVRGDLLSGFEVSSGGRTDIDRDGTPESYRACTSVEGIHLTVWAGEPLSGRRLWHYYHYVGYDMEPSCSPADFAER